MFQSTLLHEFSRTLGAGTCSSWTAGFHHSVCERSLTHLFDSLELRFDRAIVHIEIGSIFHAAHIHKLSPRSQIVIFVRSDFVPLRRSESPTSFRHQIQISAHLSTDERNLATRSVATHKQQTPLCGSAGSVPGSIDIIRILCIQSLSFFALVFSVVVLGLSQTVIRPFGHGEKLAALGPFLD